MDYVNYINTVLKPNIDESLPIVIDLFSGCGGLSLGFEAVGFKTIGYEMDKMAALTYQTNLVGNCIVKQLKDNDVFQNSRVLIGGPPCQPFSIGGKQKGKKDGRDGFPIYLNALKLVKPDICLLENVRGLLYKNKYYFDEVVSQIQDLGYLVQYQLLNAKNFEVPQNRERVIIIGSKKPFQFPKTCKIKYCAGDAIKDLLLNPVNDKMYLTRSMDEYIKRYELASNCVNPRDLNMDKPARTLTCRNLGGATSDMHRVKLPDGRRRMLTVREAARLQSFPDWFIFSGSLASQYKQIGNSVAPLLSYHIAAQIKKYLLSS